MPILIDCYNVLHAEKPTALAGLSEASLCVLLARSPWVRDGVTVVCDGLPKPNSPSADSIGEVELIYSGPNQSADDVIVDLIDQNTAPRRLTVVSNDRTIRRAARRRRARDWSAEAFLNRLAHLARHANDGPGVTSPGKPASGILPEEQIDRWLDWFGIPPDEQDSGPKRSRKRPELDPFDFTDEDLEDLEGW